MSCERSEMIIKYATNSSQASDPQFTKSKTRTKASTSKYVLAGRQSITFFYKIYFRQAGAQNISKTYSSLGVVR